jgi:HEAT repeat protein
MRGLCAGGLASIILRMTQLGRPPNFGRFRAWGLWHLVYPRVRALTVKRDTDELLALLDEGETEVPEDDRWSERALVAFALGQLKADAASDRLAALLNPDVREDVRVCAADALRNIGGPSAVEALIPALDDSHWAVRRAAIAALEADPHSEAWPRIAELATGDPQQLIRMNAAGALGESKDDAWIPLLRSAIQNDSVVVAIGAAGSLRQIESPAALDALKDARRRAPGLLRRLLALAATHRLRRALRTKGR